MTLTRDQAVDRIAKAIANANLEGDVWDALPETEFDHYVLLAEAAMKALEDGGFIRNPANLPSPAKSKDAE